MDLTIHLVTEKSKISFINHEIKISRYRSGYNKIESPNNLSFSFVSRYIAFYSTAQTADAAYVIGGQHTSFQNIVAQYYNDGNNDIWKQLSNLNRGRYGHGSILIGDKTLIIGGWAFVGESIEGE